MPAAIVVCAMPAAAAAMRAVLLMVVGEVLRWGWGGVGVGGGAGRWGAWLLNKLFIVSTCFGVDNRK